MSAQVGGSTADAAEMPLTAHLSELRSRLIKSLGAVGVGMVLGWVAYPALFELIRRPFDDVVAQAQASGRNVTLAFTGVADPFVTQFKVAALAGVIMTCPVWLYQLWRFITPGLHANERRWAVGFAALASPLFLAGVALAYVFLPRGIGVLLGFTPANVANIVSVDRYLSFFVRMLLVFGVGFLFPLVIIGLNFAGLLSAARLLSWWRGLVLGIVVFAAVATPTGDPVNLSLLAVPLLLLIAAAVAVCWLNDRRRARRAGREPRWNDDEASPLPTDPVPADSLTQTGPDPRNAPSPGGRPR
ncbi:MAG: twin-arginine translocase subunit TatC [Candidatus Nanopelagicales bacterium]